MSEQEVRARLRALGEHDQSAEAPPRVEAALLAAFREHAARPPRRTTPLRWAWAGLAAAVLVVGIAVAAVGRVDLSNRPISPPPPKAPLVPAIALVRPPDSPRPARAAVQRVRVREVATEFYPLQYGPPEAVAAVVRMSVPRTTLALFGLPMNPDRISEPVMADVAFSNGGTARAIRFVREVPVYSRISMRRGELR